MNYLSLAQNELETLEPSLFEGLNLKELNLNNNKLNSLDASLFKSMKNIETLNLLGNELNYLDKDMFFDLKDLKILVLDEKEKDKEFNLKPEVKKAFNMSEFYEIILAID